MKTITIGGVPEHFNYPWYLTLKNKDYQKKDINLRWVDYHGGTGEMSRALRRGEIDMAVILAEGIIKDIIDGNPSKIVQIFVESPLLWGIHVAANSNYKDISELRNTKAAISRYGSGSHLMAFINAEKNGWDPYDDLNFEVIQNLDGAVKALTEGKADYFMWEKFTTKPLVDQHIFRRIGVFPTPWPCFVIAVNEKFLENNAQEVKHILETVNTQTIVFKDIENIDQVISERYDQRIEDVREWLKITEWSQRNLTEATAEEIQTALFDLNIINYKADYDQLVTNLE
ncbi:ABC-type nitrate/sulfonate/bicarbonate transport system, substrate-binding protein [Flavobacteriaceae bacterium MAR_2010_188]|nr:ABC-type nitrate/sulfonate/bicarbonate transport system, substrate-binding protein [Flavobacteriaceae bacterium MAR_2010_188]